MSADTGGGPGDARPLVILDLIPDTQGWQPIKRMQACLARLLGAETETLSDDIGGLGRLARLDFAARRRRRRAGRPDLLVIAARSDHLIRLAARPGWRQGFDRAAAWIIDNFWTDTVTARDGLQHFDHVFVTWGGNRAAFETAHASLDWLPWGSDVLGLGSAGQGARACDLTRLGRQPALWDDDAAIDALCRAAGLRFSGRPPGDDGPEAYAELLRGRLVATKAVLAQSNLAGAARYTHPTREYLTARWCDAFACGCQVAGQPPLSDPLMARIDDAALIRFAAGDTKAALAALQAGLHDWTPARAARIHAMALARFDWRWRFRVLADRMDRRAPALDAEIARIEARLADHSARANVAVTKAQ